MRDTTFKLPSGATVMLRQHEGKIYAYLNDQPWYGPLDVAMARKSLLLPLPDGSGTVKATLEYNDEFSATMNNQKLLKPGEKAKKGGDRVRGNKQIRNAAIPLLVLGGLDMLFGYLLYFWVPGQLEGEDIALYSQACKDAAPIFFGVGLLIFLCGAFALRDDRTAGTPLTIAGLFYLVGVFSLVIQGQVIGALIWGVFTASLFSGAIASAQARNKYLAKQALAL